MAAAIHNTQNRADGNSNSGCHREIGTSMGASLAARQGPMDAAALAKALGEQQRAAEARRVKLAVATGGQAPPHRGGAGGARVVVGQQGSGPIGLDPSAFLSRQGEGDGSRGGGGGQVGGAGRGDAKLLGELLQSGAVQQAVLVARLAATRALGAFWAAGDVRGALGHLQLLRDCSVTADFLRAGGLRSCSSLESAALFLPSVACLLESAFEQHLSQALTAALELLGGYGRIVADTRAAAALPGVGIDLKAEERLERCDACYGEFSRMHRHLASLSHQPLAIRQPAKELARQMEGVLGLPPS
ncbi:con80 domain of katanin-domain-containing protein [Pavlovales sp. CCMP2436]|nr:con80 domain of katanin-domain-containing protein [Pavlovales sp. CCMP2436]